MAAIRLAGVTKRFRSAVAVSDLSLEVPEGSIFGFIGPNGSGKTTTLRMILHILHPDSGTIEVLGRTGRRASNDRVGYLPEERGLYRKMPVGRVLEYYAGLKGIRPREARREAAAWLARLGLADRVRSRVESLSKGMQQKVQFIATVLSRPALLILDEPFTGLDPVNRDVLRDAILALRRNGTTVVFSTHDMRTAEELCDSICMIFRGKKVLDGSLASIQESEGRQVVRLRQDGRAAALAAHPRVRSFRDLGRFQEIEWDGDPQDLLKKLLAEGPVEHFEIARPSLHEIFVRIAGEGSSPGQEALHG